MLLLRARAGNNSLNASNSEQQKPPTNSIIIEKSKQDRANISPARGGALNDSQPTSSGIHRTCNRIAELPTTVNYPPLGDNYTSYYHPDGYNEQQNTNFRETMNGEEQMQQLRPTNYSPISTGYYMNTGYHHPNNPRTDSLNQLESQQVMPITTVVPATARNEGGIEFPLIRTSCASQSTTTYETSYESLQG